MFGLHDIPEAIRTAPDGLYGDVELFLKSYTAGEQDAAWSQLEAINAVCSEAKVRAFVNSSNHLSTYPATPFLPS